MARKKQVDRLTGVPMEFHLAARGLNVSVKMLVKDFQRVSYSNTSPQIREAMETRARMDACIKGFFR